MTDTEVVESFENAWRALVKLYDNNPTEETRVALNMLSKIIGQVKSEVQAQKEEKQKEHRRIELEQWIGWFTEEA